MVESTSLPLWIAEDITWVFLWGFLLAGIFGFSWFVSKNNLLLISTLVTLALIVLAIFIEQRVITDREYLQNAVRTMAKSVRNNDADGIVQFIHVDNQKMIDQVRNELSRYRVSTCSLFGFNRKELLPNEKQPSSAHIGFAVFGSGQLTRYSGDTFSANVVVELDFEKKNGVWGIVNYRYRPSNSPNWQHDSK